MTARRRRKNRHGINHDQNPRYRLPAEPTDTRPGSEERLRVMEERAARGESVFHPDDVSVLPDDDRLDADGPH